MSKTLLDHYAELFDPQQSILASKYKFLPLNVIINIQKLGTLFVMFFMMVYFNNFSLGCWVYLALHGNYGIEFIKTNNNRSGLGAKRYSVS